MKTYKIVFRFMDCTRLEFEFNQLNEGNVEEIAIAIGEGLQQRLQILQSKASKYFKKSNVLSHRKFHIDFISDNKTVKTALYNVECSNKLARDYRAITSVIEILLGQYMTEKQTLVCLN